MYEDIYELNDRRVRVAGSRIVVRKIDPPKVTPGGIVIPDTAIGRSHEGVILAIGPDVKERDALRPGRRVHFNMYSGSTKLPHPGTETIASIPEVDCFFVYEDAR